LGGTNGDVDSGLLGVGDADSVRLVVAELDLVAVEETPRVGERQGELRVLHRLEPHERGLLAAGQERIAPAAQADEPVRELDDGLVGYLYGAEPARLERDGLGGHWRGLLLPQEVQEGRLDDRCAAPKGGV